MIDRSIPTAVAIAVTTTEELHRMLERLVLNDSYQCGWAYWQAHMLEHWADLVAQEEPHYVVLAKQLTEFARWVRVQIACHTY